MDPIIKGEMGEVRVQNESAIERAYFVERLLAAFFDNFIIKVPFLLITFFFWLPLINKQTDLRLKFVVLILAVLIEFIAVIAYFAGFAFYRDGQTVGKRLNGIKVTDLQGNNLSLGHFIAREFMARGIIVLGSVFIGNLANFWILTYLLSLTKRRRALHDIITRTQVIRA